MSVKEAIEKRYSVRAFVNRDVSDADIMEILESGHLAPSGKNRQPWKFKVVRGKQKKVVSDIIGLMYAKHPVGLGGKGNSSIASAKAIEAASVLILVFREKDDVWKEVDLISIGAAVENMCLVATDNQIGSLLIKDVMFAEEKIKDYLGCGELELVLGVVLGYPDTNNFSRQRKKIEEIIL